MDSKRTSTIVGPVCVSLYACLYVIEGKKVLDVMSTTQLPCSFICFSSLFHLLSSLMRGFGQ